MPDKCLKTSAADLSLAHMPVPIDSAAERHSRIVEMQQPQTPQADKPIELPQHPVNHQPVPQIISGGKKMSGIKTDTDLILLHESIEYHRQVFKT